MNDPLDDLAAGIDPARMGQAKIAIDAFIAAYNLGEAELIDIRVAEETAVWQVNIGLRIPAPELPARLDELPKDKLLVIACPHTDRSNMARSYLVARGFNAKYLQGGLLGLVDRLKGVGAQDICLRDCLETHQIKTMTYGPLGKVNG